MIYKKSFFLPSIFLFTILFNCKEVKIKPLKINLPTKISEKKNTLSNKEKENWFLRDVILDTIPGISLQKAHDSLLINKNPNEIIIAVLDSEIDILHESLKNNIWINKKETPNNIDDDKNGYIDDINGWNFLGNKNGENNTFTSYAFTRVVKKLNFKYENVKVIKDSSEYIHYLKAKEKLKKKTEFAKGDIEYANMIQNSLTDVNKYLLKYFPKRDFTLEKLDSLKIIYLNNKELQEKILIKSNFIKYGFSKKYIDNYKLEAEERIDKLLNLTYNDRIVIGDNPEDINDSNYGNRYVNKNINVFKHGTEIAGGILSVNKKNIKIMPICISPYGDERDKDIAIGIKYAVDNGAKIINMSFGKEFSQHKEWVFDAMKYAEEHNVLIVSSSGNSGYDLNKKNDYYPNDNVNNGKEVTNNFLLVGGISCRLNKKFLFYNTNYGNIDVDLFAPAEDIFTTFPNNKNDYDTGTSLASAITCGAASIIYQNYPNLSVSQIKHIIMNSGLKYPIEISTPSKEDKNKTTPFNKLSKSGRVLNIYNAFIMADSIANN